MNIILIIFDTLRYDYIGANGNKWIKTPNFDRLAAKSRVFDRSFSASYPTIPHRTDVITGKYGSPFFPWRPLRYDHVTFPQILAENGYCTQLIHDTPHMVNGGTNFDYPFHAWTQERGAEVDRPWIDTAGPLLDNWAWDPLFDEFDKDSMKSVILKTYNRSNRHRREHEDWNCARLFRTASRWLQANADRNNFFLWVDSFDPHEPWDTPPDFAKMYDDDPDYDGRIDPRGLFNRVLSLSDKAKNRVAAWYAAKVSWADRWLGELLDTLEETKLDERTAILVTADHGTNVNDWSRFGKGFPVREQEGHTPFMVYVPGEAPGRSAIFVQPQDVFATVLGFAEIPVPSEIDSHNVLSAAASGGSGPRDLALSGEAPGLFPGTNLKGKCESFYTVFGDEFYLISNVKPEKSELVRYGSQEDAAASHPQEVELLHKAGINELERRGADPRLVEWLRSYGEGDFPEDCLFWDGYPGPAGYDIYFRKNFDAI